MPDITPLEAAEILEMFAKGIDNFFPNTKQSKKPMQVYLRCAASILRQIAAGGYKQMVHGHLKDHYSGEYDNFAICSICGAENLDNSKFCRMCGALMDGKGDNDA